MLNILQILELFWKFELTVNVKHSGYILDIFNPLCNSAARLIGEITLVTDLLSFLHSKITFGKSCTLTSFWSISFLQEGFILEFFLLALSVSPLSGSLSSLYNTLQVSSGEVKLNVLLANLYAWSSKSFRCVLKIIKEENI